VHSSNIAGTLGLGIGSFGNGTTYFADQKLSTVIVFPENKLAEGTALAIEQNLGSYNGVTITP
jgi:hypothetical protein